MPTTWHDIRYAVRLLIRAPGFTAVVVITLALGIGVNTAVFSVADALMFRPLPFAHADRLVEILQRDPSYFAYPGLRRDAFEEWRGQGNIFERVEAYDPRSYTLTGGKEPETITVPAVSPGLFAFLGVHGQTGRLFQPEDEQSRVALISQEFWRRYFGGANNIVGQTLTLNDQLYNVVGVMPPGFKFPYGDFELWIPLSLNPPSTEKRARFYAIGRLRNGMSVARAQTAIDMLSKRLDQERPDRFGWGAQLSRLDKRIEAGPRRALLVLLGAVGFVLLLACFNAANLLLSRATSRRSEIAIRLALGAGRLRVVRQLLIESVILALLSGVGGALLAFWSIDLLRKLAPPALTFISAYDITLDARVLVFTLLLSLLTAAISGLVPAVRVSRPDLQLDLNAAGSRTTADRANNRLRGALVVAEVGLSLMLLVGAGLMIRSFLRLSKVAPGFDSRNLIAAAVALPQSRYPAFTQEQDFFTHLAESLEGTPGIEAVTVAAGTPPHGGGVLQSFHMEIDSGSISATDQEISLPYTDVDPNYFQVMRIPLLQGRTFGPAETVGAPQSVIINEEMARRYWPSQDPLGKRFRNGSQGTWQTVVGVVGSVKVEGMDDPFGKLEVYYPWSQESRRTLQRTVIARTTANPAGMIPVLKGRIWALDKDQPIQRIDSVDNLLRESLAERRFYLMLMSCFGAVALVLVTMGIYSVIDYLVSQRTHEIGIRMALGASRGNVLRLVLSQGLGLILGGIGIGLIGALAATRVIAAMLFGISATDSLTFALIMLLLIIVGALACYLPARRATKVDPLVALRYE